MAFELAMRFIDQSSSFARGFKCGQIEERLSTQIPFTDLILVEEREQIEMMCKRHLVTFTIIPISEEWLSLNVIPNIWRNN
jgi:hypothetical protein